MDTQEQLNRFKGFIEQTYHAELLEIARQGKRSIILDFNDISKFDISLAEDVLDDPEELIKTAELAIEQFDLSESASSVIHVRIKNLPQSTKVMIRDIRSIHINKFITIEGVVRQKSDVRPQVICAKFECPSCGNIIPVLQLDNKFKEPSSCGCGRKGKFRILSKDLVDAQSMKLEECIEYLEGGQQPKHMKIFLKDDLVSPMAENMTNPGTKVVINGIVKEVPIILKSGIKSTTVDLMVECNYIEPVEEEFGAIKITKEDEQNIKSISEDINLLQNLVDSISPSIYGNEKIKEALLLQLVGGVKKNRKDGTRVRGDIHILLVGDPGKGKSQILKRIDKVAPKSRFVSGKGASGAGLTAAVVRDEFLGGWALEAGALVLANKGLICIDELDKMSKEDTSAMHEALEGQLVTISKANIQATLRCETTVLAAANPKFGNFNPYSKTLADQIELSPTLINRFDMIFPIIDRPDKKEDEKLGKFLFDLDESEDIDAPIDTHMLRKYIAYARNFRPKFSPDAIKKCVDYYVDVRSSGTSESGMRPIPISARQMEGIKRMAEAYAKLELSDRVLSKHASYAIEMMNYWLTQIAYDSDENRIDISRYTIGEKSSDLNKMSLIYNIIKILSGESNELVPIENIIHEASNKNISEYDLDNIIEKLKKKGDIFEPKNGFIKTL